MKAKKILLLFFIFSSIFAISSCSKVGSCKCHISLLGAEDTQIYDMDEVGVSSCSEMEDKIEQSGLSADCSFTL